MTRGLIYSRHAAVMRALCLIATLTARVAAGRDTPPSPEDVPWPSYNQTLGGERFSALTEINEGNASTLVQRCRVAVSAAGAFHASPVMLDGRLFLAAAHTTMAVDPADCTVLWKTLHSPADKEVYGTVRGVAVADNRLFRGTIDGHLLAFNAATGEPLWNVKAADSEQGEFFSAAPLVDSGKVYLGLAGGDWGIRGRMMAFGAADGHELWRFNLVPATGEPGAETWTTGAALHGGGGTWTSYALDPGRRELFVPVGNPAPDFNTRDRSGKNLYTNALVVLDADNGRLKWWYQVSPSDDKDHDLSAPPVLFTTREGRSAVALGSKNGYVLVIDRDSHRLLYRSPVTTILNERERTADAFGKFCPGMFGGVGWNGPAFDLPRQALIVGATDWCARLRRTEPRYIRGALYYGGDYEWLTDPPPSGWISALDADTGQIRWKFHAPAPVVSGITPTAGGIAFAGDLAGHFYALRSRDGAILLQADTHGALAGGISTYRYKGRQYVAVASGNISRESWGALGAPSLLIYALPEGPATRSAPLLQPPDAARGSSVFATTCALCHGPQGEGVTAPPLAGKMLPPADIIERIKAPRGAMPRLYPEPLSDQELLDVAEYAHQLP